jgi:hypothetical protein
VAAAAAAAARKIIIIIIIIIMANQISETLIVASGALLQWILHWILKNQVSHIYIYAFKIY